jgi:SAM-dependent methyltransferase
VDETRRTWLGSMPDAYERGLVDAVFRPFAVDLASRVAARSPRRVLELAAGTGVVTQELMSAVPTAEVTATDLNTSMVELGRRQVPGATWQEADAMDLPFADAQFDLVACQFGAMFFADKPAAFAEGRRVLVDGGRFVMNVWDAVDKHDFQAALIAAVHAAFPDDPPTFMESLPHGYADVDAVMTDLSAAGLRVMTIESVTLVGRATSARVLAEGYCRGTPLRAEIEARRELAAATDVVAREMERRLGTGAVTGRMSAWVVEAQRDPS